MGAARKLLGEEWTQAYLAKYAGIGNGTLRTMEGAHAERIRNVAIESLEKVIDSLTDLGVEFINRRDKYGVLVPKPKKKRGAKRTSRQS